jgi:hypothetical protein
MENLIILPVNEFKSFIVETFRTEFQNAISNIKKEKEEKLYSRSELAKYLNVTPATITNYKNAGCPYLSMKNKPRYKIEEVEKFMESNNNKKRNRII